MVNASSLTELVFHKLRSAQLEWIQGAIFMCDQPLKQFYFPSSFLSIQNSENNVSF